MPESENTYEFDQNLLPDQAFAYTPPPEPDVSELTLSEKWMTRLITLCKNNDDDIDKDAKLKALKYKITSDSEYTHRDMLNKALALIYYRLSGMLDKRLGPLSPSEQHLIIDKLLEGAHRCMPGFHNRVEAIAQSICQPKNLSHYLYCVRRSLIVNTATRLSDEVHADNHVSVIANADGLGIKPLLKEDPYSGGLTTDAIRQALQTTFRKDYHWFNLPTLFCDELRGVLMTMGYSGKNETIKYGTYTKILEHLETLFDLTPCIDDAYKKRIKELFVTKDDDSITNINWGKIETLFYNTCVNQKIIKKSIPCHTLFNCAAFVKLKKANLEDMLKKGDILLREINSSKGIMPALIALASVKEFNPTYYQKLDKSYLVDSIRQLSEETCQSFITDVLKQHASLPVLLELIHPLPAGLAKDLLTSINQNNNNALMLAAAPHHTALPAILEALSKQDLDTQKTVWTHTDDAGNNALMLMLVFMMILPHRFGPEYNSAALLPAILKALGKQDLDTRKKVLTQRCNTGLSALMIAASIKTISPLLTLLETLDKQPIETQMEVFAQTNNKDYNALMITAIDKPMAFLAILESLDKHSLQTQANVLIQKDNLGINTLMIAACTNPGLVPSIFETLSKQDLETQKIILTQTTQTKDNALTLATPETYPFFWEALRKQTPSTLLRIIEPLSLEKRKHMFSTLNQHDWDTLINELVIDKDSLGPLVRCIEALPEKIKYKEKNIFLRELFRRCEKSKTKQNINTKRLNTVFNTLTENKYRRLSPEKKGMYMISERYAAACRASFFCPRILGSYFERYKQNFLPKITAPSA